MKDLLWAADEVDQVSTNVALESSDCPMGCQANDEIVLVGRDRLHDLPGKFSVVKCGECGLMRTNPRPTAASISFYYPDDYGPYLSSATSRPENGGSWKNSRIFSFARYILDSRDKSLPELKVGRMLEIGCAAGSFLQVMAKRGWEVEGIEFAEKAAVCGRANGLHIFTGALEEAPTPERPFNLIVGWMVLEHLHKPRLCLEKLHSWAASDAWLAISVPDCGAFDFKLFKDRWYALHLPCHLSHFTRETVGRLLNDTGWKVEKVQYQRNPNNLLISAAYAACDAGWFRTETFFRNLAALAGPSRLLLAPLAWFLAMTRQSGRITIWARKESAAAEFER